MKSLSKNAQLILKEIEQHNAMAAYYLMRSDYMEAGWHVVVVIPDLFAQLELEMAPWYKRAEILLRQLLAKLKPPDDEIPF